MNDKAAELFKLIDLAYNHLPDQYETFKKQLLIQANALNEDADYLQVVADLYHALSKLTAEDRMHVPEIKAITLFVSKDMSQLSAKQLRQYNLAIGLAAFPLMF